MTAGKRRPSLAACWPRSPPPRSTASTAGSSGSRWTSRPGCPGSRSSASPTRPSRRHANGSAARCATPGSSIRHDGSPSTSRRPTCARPAPRWTSRWPSGSSSARSRCGAGAGRLGAHRRAVAGRRGPLRAGCAADGRRARPARVCAASWSPTAAVDEARLVAGSRCRRRHAGRRGRGRSARRRRRTRAAIAPRRVELGEAPTGRSTAAASAVDAPGGPVPDLAEVRGQAQARRGLEIALAGGHGLLMVGPPGSGKTLLARTIPGLLPPLDDAAALAATVVASAAGEGPIARASAPRAVPSAAPHDLLRGDGRRRAADVAGRGHPCGPGMPVPR